MKNSSPQLSLTALTTQLRNVLAKLNTYKVFIFFLVISAFYGFIVWRINVFSNAPANESEISAQTTPQPRIDEATVEKIQNLQDNSVNVQSLFAPTRQNPFQE